MERFSNDHHSRRPGAMNRRRLSITVAGLALTGLAACQRDESHVGQGHHTIPGAKDIVYLSVSLFSYLDRPIFDVYLNGKDIGVASPFGGGGGLMTGVPVPLGPQVVTWRLDGPKGMPGNGDTVTAAHQPIFVLPDRKLSYLGVHIYPDNTVELVPSLYWPETTPRGDDLRQKWKARQGR